jgi:hypothetical protein
MITELVKHDAMFNEFSRRRLVLAFEERVPMFFGFPREDLQTCHVG